MRTLAILLLLLPDCVSAQLQLSPKDEADIRAAIDEYAKKENQRGTGDVWSERGPFVYRVHRIESLAPQVATADADGVRIQGMNAGRRLYTFILIRARGRWTVAKRVAVCSGEPTVQPILDSGSAR